MVMEKVRSLPPGGPTGPEEPSLPSLPGCPDNLSLPGSPGSEQVELLSASTPKWRRQMVPNRVRIVKFKLFILVLSTFLHATFLLSVVL